MNPKAIFCFFLLIPLISFSQGEFNNWYFGIYSTLTFNYGAPQVLPPNPMFQGQMVGVSVSDSAGNILFFSNGEKIWNRSNSVMTNSYGLMGQGCCNQLISVPSLADKNQYYFFTVPHHPHPWEPMLGLRYSVLDMQLSWGYGDIVPGMKNISLPMGDSAYCQLTATRHQNNRDVWVVTLRHGKQRQYLAYLIDSSGIHTTPVVSSSTLYSSLYQGPQFMRISPDGTTLVCSDSLMEVCAFDKSTGIVTPKFNCRPGYLNTSGDHAVCGKEFSIDSRFLYVLAEDSGVIYSAIALFQFDMNNQDSVSFMQSRIKIRDSVEYGIQMAPDGKIYVACYQDFYRLDAINNPSVAGLGCNYQSHALTLTNMVNSSLPQFLQKYKAYVHYTKGCLADSVHFSADIWPPPDSIHWDFGEPALGINNYSNLTRPVHLYATPGNHTVELWVRHNDKRTDTTWVSVNIPAPPNPQLGSDRTICTGTSVTFDAGGCATCTFLWTNLSTGLPVGAAQTFTTGVAGLYEVMVADANGCTGKDTVELSITPVPVLLNNPPAKTICTGESTQISLLSNASGANFYWTASLTTGTVTGFSPDSGLVINQMLINTGAAAGVVTYHITPKAGECAGTPVDYAVTVNVGNPVAISIAASDNPICAGASVNFTSNSINAGLNPMYQWKVNANNVSNANNAVFTYTPVNGDCITCQLTSDITCPVGNPALSNTICMIVDPLLPVSVTVTTPLTTVCAGTSVTFTANPTHGGTLPGYQWKVNASNVINGNNASYAYNAVNGDVVTCELTSSESCVSGNPALSNEITMTVNASLPAGVSISTPNNPFCQGAAVPFTATPVNGGSTPGYQWKVNANNAINGNNASYAYNPVNGDVVSCVMNSNLNCVTGNPATSAPITMIERAAPNVTFTSCFDTITTISAKPFKLKGGLPPGGTYSGPGVNSLTGTFTPSIAGIGSHLITYSYNNTYNCQASATRSIDIRQSSFVNCGTPLTDIRDNKVYATVLIGSQCWMKENLDFGFQISDLTPQTDNCVAEKFIRYSIFNIQYSTFYQWDELMQYQTVEGSQGLCPPGWHVPTSAEWDQLVLFCSGSGQAGGPLKDTLLVNGFQSHQQGFLYLNNTWAFTAGLTAGAMYWTSTASGTKQAVARGLNEYNPSVSRYEAARGNAFSVRCLKD